MSRILPAAIKYHLFKFLIGSLVALLNAYSLKAQVWADVAPLIYNHCTTCHRPGEIGPFPLLTYNDAFQHAISIQTQVDAKLMPPWKADPEYRHFLGERILSQSEIDLIGNWVDNGALPGDTTLAPPAPTFPTGSQLGVPDLVLTMIQPYTVIGNDSDQYMCFVLPTGLLQDQNIAAIEFRAGNASVVHHSFIYICDDGSAAHLDSITPGYGYPSFGGAGDNVSADFIGLYGPGLAPRFYPPQSGVLFHAGTDVIIQVHYAPTLIQTTDVSSINLFFTTDSSVRKVYAKRVGEGYITNGPFTIYANEVDTFYSEYPIPHDYSLFAIAPHQHLLGSSYRLFAVTPTNDTLPLIDIPHWNFHWQMLYSYPFMLKIPENTIIYARAVYDNTIYNIYNPNLPPVNVHYGESSEDEMFKYFLNTLDYLPGDENIILDSSYVITNSNNLNTIVSTPQLYGCSPSPASDETWITYYLPNPVKTSIEIYNLSGKLMMEFSQQESPGYHKKRIDLRNFSKGEYIVSLRTTSSLISKKFIVQR